MTHYGKICPKHPELKGLRRSTIGKQCVQCHRNDSIRRRREQRTGAQKEYYRKIDCQRQAELLQRYKKRVIEAYGGKCQKCGEIDPDMLTVDHINHDGSSHRKELTKGQGRGTGGGSMVVYRWLIKNKFPTGFRILCFNHNIKEHLLWIRSLT